ncbi:MAG: hypothetical protein IJ357_05570 [Oscillospiraceae bacterium]|nr:hypothetical protein [Oscillospiraceae bacterium]
METMAMENLVTCLELCTELESLMDQDREEFSRCITGEIRQKYADAADGAKERLLQLKSELQQLQELLMLS